MHRPVVAPSTRGICDYFAPDQILLFEPNNVDDLAAKILWVFEQPEESQRVMERGFEVYGQNLWHREKARFLRHVSGLVKTMGFAFFMP